MMPSLPLTCPIHGMASGRDAIAISSRALRSRPPLSPEIGGKGWGDRGSAPTGRRTGMGVSAILPLGGGARRALLQPGSAADSLHPRKEAR
jgi:hypothetical protein